MNLEDIKQDLEIVLEFVERYNKQDEEIQVAESAQKLDTLLKELKK